MSSPVEPAPGAPLPEAADVVVVGCGFSGIAMAVKLLAAGVRDLVVLERADDLGGTWRDNTYPGCACDVPSHLYSFSFAPNPRWSSTYSPQPEIQQYLRDVAERHGVMPYVRFGCELEESTWDEEAGRWRLRTSRGELSARVFVSAAGPLSEPSIPRVPGLERFRGTTFHSAQWPADHDLAGERVAVVGTGASSIQFVPQIQPDVAALHIFQRTPAWIMRRRARPLTPFEHRLYRRFPAAQRAVRNAVAWTRELIAIPILHPRWAPLFVRLAEAHMAKQVPDPDLRARVTPTYLPGCKRILSSNDYLPALAEPNVEVVPAGISEVREHSVVAEDGTERDVDTIVFGTGFNVTDLPVAGRVHGRAGRRLDQAWEQGRRAYRGTAIAGFPNLFLLIGPNSGLGHTSIVLMAEAQADHVVTALRHMEEHRIDVLEVHQAAQDAWNAQIDARMEGTVWLRGGCTSWYLDEHGHNTVLWPDYAFRFRRALGRFAPGHYDARRTDRSSDPRPAEVVPG